MSEVSFSEFRADYVIRSAPSKSEFQVGMWVGTSTTPMFACAVISKYWLTMLITITDASIFLFWLTRGMELRMCCHSLRQIPNSEIINKRTITSCFVPLRYNRWRYVSFQPVGIRPFSSWAADRLASSSALAVSHALGLAPPLNVLCPSSCFEHQLSLASLDLFQVCILWSN